MFHVLAWVVLGAYLTAVVGLGLGFRRRAARRREFFLAARSMPTWAVAISILATSLSAATFVGVPELAYTGDLTYLSANLGVRLDLPAFRDATGGRISTWLATGSLLGCFHYRVLDTCAQVVGGALRSAGHWGPALG